MNKKAFYISHLSQSVEFVDQARIAETKNARSEWLTLALAKIRLACDVAGLDYHAIERDSYQAYLDQKISEQR